MSVEVLNLPAPAGSIKGTCAREKNLILFQRLFYLALRFSLISIMLKRGCQNALMIATRGSDAVDAVSRASTVSEKTSS